MQIPLWAIIYGVAWLLWLCCVIGGVANQKILGLFTSTGGYKPSEQYLRGIEEGSMKIDNDIKFV